MTERSRWERRVGSGEPLKAIQPPRQNREIGSWKKKWCEGKLQWSETMMDTSLWRMSGIGGENMSTQNEGNDIVRERTDEMTCAKHYLDWNKESKGGRRTVTTDGSGRNIASYHSQRSGRKRHGNGIGAYELKKAAWREKIVPTKWQNSEIVPKYRPKGYRIS